MEKSFAALAAFVFLLATQLASAQGLGVTYVDGSADVRSGSAWTALAIGDTVPLDSSVRLSSESTLQLKGAGSDYFLNRPGTYAIRDIVAARKATSSPGVGSALVNALRYLAVGKSNRQSATLGARGANQSDTENDAWVDSSAEAFVDAAKELIASGNYAKARDTLKEAMNEAGDDEKPQIRYYLAYASSLEGNPADAWKQLEVLAPGGTDAWRGDFLLLKARLLIDSSAYGEAVTLLTGSARDLAQDAQRAPLYYFLLGLGYRGAGDTDSARQALTRLSSISPGSDLASSADALMKSW